MASVGAGGARSIAGWQAQLAPLFAARCYEPFAASLAPDEAKGLLGRRVVAEALTAANADEAALLIARLFVEQEPLTIATGIGLENARTMYTRIARLGARHGDPLSVVVRVDGRVEGVMLMWDHDRLPLPPSLLAGMPREWVAQWLDDRRSNDAVDDALHEGARALDPAVGDREHQRWIEFFMCAVNAPLRVYSSRRQRSFTQELNSFVLDRVAECGAYTHVYVHTHANGFRVWNHLGAQCQQWRVRSQAPARAPTWDVRIDADDGKYVNAVSQLRPTATHSWTRDHGGHL